jgi:hypothetical protein
MNEFLNAIKVDLLDRRRRPLLMIALAALIGAVAYAAIASKSSSNSSQNLGPEPAVGASGVHVTQGQSTNQAVAETTGGATQQHGGSSRDPFAPLPGAVQPASKAASTSSSTTTTTTSSASGGGSGSGSSSGGGGGGGAPAPAHTPHVKFKTVYRVAVLFGKAAPGTPAAEANLTPYENLKLNQLIPSKKEPIVAFRGVLSDGQSAAFTLVGEAIPRGLGVCKPSAVQCQTLDLKVGQTEELEALAPNGEMKNYELQVASIVFVTTAKAAAASNHSYGAGVSPSGSALLKQLGLVAMPGLRYSPSTNLLYAPGAHQASRAHVARLRTG